MAEAYDTAMDLLHESIDALEASAAACEVQDDADHLRQLAERIRRYLATSRSTTTLGMPRIASESTELSAAKVVHRSRSDRYGHVRIVPE